MQPRTELHFLHQIVDHMHARWPAELVLDDATIARLAHALTDQTVRSGALGLCIGPQAEAAEHLWTVLVRAVPPNWLAHPAYLLGMCGFLRGSGTLAAITLDLACAADPNHPAATAIRQAMQGGLRPAQLREFLESSAMLLRDDDPVPGAGPDGSTEAQG